MFPKTFQSLDEFRKPPKLAFLEPNRTEKIWSCNGGPMMINHRTGSQGAFVVPGASRKVFEYFLKKLCRKLQARHDLRWRLALEDGRYRGRGQALNRQGPTQCRLHASIASTLTVLCLISGPLRVKAIYADGPRLVCTRFIERTPALATIETCGNSLATLSHQKALKTL